MSCLYCPAEATSCTWCDGRQRPTIPDARARFPGASATQLARARSGRQHAQGLAMPAEGSPACVETCGSCAHLERRERTEARTFLKCALGPHSFGRATDVRAKWPACARWRSPAADEADQRAEVEAGRGP